MWRHGAVSNFPAVFAPVLLRLAKLSKVKDTRTDDYDWKEVLEALRLLAPREAAELLAEALTDVELRNFQRSEYAQEVFRELAKDHPELAMQAIGKWILDKRRGAIFRIWEFRGIFDAIGLPTVKPWVEENGSAGAIGIARHIDGPRIENGSPVIPQLADWLLSTYRNVPEVFREFARGRHSGEARWGRARDRENDLQNLLKHFESSPQEWVQQWVRYERKSHQWEVEQDDRRDEEDGRI
jgi:hypothetical protein